MEKDKMERARSAYQKAQQKAAVEAARKKQEQAVQEQARIAENLSELEREKSAALAQLEKDKFPDVQMIVTRPAQGWLFWKRREIQEYGWKLYGAGGSAGFGDDSQSWSEETLYLLADGSFFQYISSHFWGGSSVSRQKVDPKDIASKPQYYFELILANLRHLGRPR